MPFLFLMALKLILPLQHEIVMTVVILVLFLALKRMVLVFPLSTNPWILVCDRLSKFLSITILLSVFIRREKRIPGSNGAMLDKTGCQGCTEENAVSRKQDS